MRVVVVGAGAVGGYVGARLSQGGHEVTLVTRPARVEALAASGVTVVEAGSESLAHPQIAGDLGQAVAAGRPDLVVMAVKAYDLAAAVAALPAGDEWSGTIITLQNGIGVEQVAIDRFGARRVVAGSLTTPISRANCARLLVERSGRGLALAPAAAGQDIASWAALFGAAGIAAITVADYEAMKWSKALLNIVGNASSAILNRPPGEVYQMPGMFELERAMLREAVTVMRSLKLEPIDLPGSPARRLAQAARYIPSWLLRPILTRQVARGRGEKMPSFHIDLVSGRGQSEVGVHNGAIARKAIDLGQPAPVNATLDRILTALVRGERERAEFDGRPGRLLAEVGREP